MAKTLDEMKSELLGLPREERVELLDALASSLEGDEEVEQAWKHEVERRLDDIRAGKTELIDNDEVFADLRARFG